MWSKTNAHTVLFTLFVLQAQDSVGRPEVGGPGTGPVRPGVTMSSMSYRPSRANSGRATPVGGGERGGGVAVCSDDGGEMGSHMQTLMSRLVEVEQHFARLKNEGQHLEALHYMELSVFLRKQIYGADRSMPA